MQRNYPPGPRTGLFGVALARRFLGDMIGCVVGLKEEFGDCVYFRIGPVRAYQFADPDAIREVLVTKAGSFRKPSWWKRVFRRWNGNSIFVNDLDTWAQQRPLVEAAIDDADISRFADLVVRHTRARLENIHAWEAGIITPLERLTFDVTAEAVLGLDAHEIGQRLFDEFTNLHAIGIRELKSFMYVPDWFPSPAKRRMRRSLKFCEETLLRCAERRRSGSSHDDLLARLMSVTGDEGGALPMSEQAAREEATSLIFAGKESPAAAIAWTMYLLARHPEEQDKVAAEIDRVLAGARPAAEHVEGLTYTQMAIKEAMRLYPPAYLLSREATEDVQIAGYDVRRRSQVMLATYAVHHDPRWYPDPERFLPDRFSPESAASIPEFAYLAFGAGRRVCVGEAFSLMEGVLVLATILSAYRLQLAPDQGEPEFELHVALYPKGGLPLRLRPRARQGDPAAEPASVP